MRRKFIFVYFQKTYETVTGKDSLPPNLFLTAVDLLYPGLLEQASRELWMSAWSKVSHKTLLMWTFLCLVLYLYEHSSLNQDFFIGFILHVIY